MASGKKSAGTPDDSGEIKLTVDSVHRLADYTLYPEPESPDGSKPLRKRAADPKKRGAPVHLTLKSNTTVQYRGRALVCSCFRRRKLSLTVRGDLDKDPDCEKFHTPYAMGPTARGLHTGYTPDTAPKDGDVSIHDICEQLASMIFSKERIPDRGLIVIAGSTASAKSLVARGLIKKYLFAPDLLGNVDVRKRRPHLVTCEDPIEKELLPIDAEPKKQLQAYDPILLGVDYTPREIGSDVEDLEQAIRDAKRQTPSVFYYGEVRNRDDWEMLLQFAATGHLVVTTTHAESLQVTMASILNAVKARTPASRGEVASRIRALVHQKLLTIDGKHRAIIPSLWRQTPQGLAELVTDGLSAIIPNNPPATGAKGDSTDLYSCIGRAWFTSKLCAPLDPELRAHYLRRGSRDDISGE